MDEIFQGILIAIFGLISWLADRAAKKKRAAEQAERAKRQAQRESARVESPASLPSRPAVTGSPEREPAEAQAEAQSESPERPADLFGELRRILEAQGAEIEVERRKMPEPPPPAAHHRQRGAHRRSPPTASPARDRPVPGRSGGAGGLPSVAAVVAPLKAAPVHPLVRRLRRPGGAREAVVLSEILGRPLALHEPSAMEAA